MVRQILPAYKQSFAGGMTEVREGLWIGDISAAASVLLSEDHYHFTDVLSLAPSTILSSFCSPTTKSPKGDRAFAHDSISATFEVAKRGSFLLRMVLPLMDTPGQSLTDVFKPCIDFIDSARKRGGKVLVHCVAGVSRSAAILTAYLMKTEGLPLKAALSSLKEKHERASPNFGFLQQLQSFEKICLSQTKDEAGQEDHE